MVKLCNRISLALNLRCRIQLRIDKIRLAQCVCYFTPESFKSSEAENTIRRI